MKRLFTFLTLLLSVNVLAHDEGHGPKLTDAPKQGGVVSPVIQASEAKLGSKAQLVYKGELVRSEDGTVRLYLYNSKMEPLPLSTFDKSAKAIVEVEKKKQVLTTPFELKLEGNSFVGKAPLPAVKPFNIDVQLKEGDRKLLVAFDNLD